MKPSDIETDIRSIWMHYTVRIFELQKRRFFSSVTLCTSITPTAVCFYCCCCCCCYCCSTTTTTTSIIKSTITTTDTAFSVLAAMVSSSVPLLLLLPLMLVLVLTLRIYKELLCSRCSPDTALLFR